MSNRPLERNERNTVFQQQARVVTSFAKTVLEWQLKNKSDSSLFHSCFSKFSLLSHLKNQACAQLSKLGLKTCNRRWKEQWLTDCTEIATEESYNEKERLPSCSFSQINPGKNYPSNVGSQIQASNNLLHQALMNYIYHTKKQFS